MRRMAIAFVVCLVWLASASPGLSAVLADAPEIRSARGIVTSRDWVGSTITVNYIRFHVPAGIKVYKGSTTVGFTAININDPVIVKYYQDSSGAYNAVEITVEYGGDFPV